MIKIDFGVEGSEFCDDRMNLVPRGNEAATKELCPYQCHGSGGPKAKAKSKKETSYGKVYQGKVNIDDERYMRCDMMEYTLTEDSNSTAPSSRTVAASKSGIPTLIIARKKSRWDWTPEAEEGRHPPFRMYIWVCYADNVSWFIHHGRK